MVSMPERLAPWDGWAYAELWAQSNFTFLQAASHPEELVQRAHDLRYAALALTDECSVAGVVRAHQQAKALGLKFIPGSLFLLSNGWRLIALPRNLKGWGDLCETITHARMAAEKGQYVVSAEPSDWAHLTQIEWVLCPAREAWQREPLFETRALGFLNQWLRFHPDNSHLGVVLWGDFDDAWWLGLLTGWATATSCGVVAAGAVRMHLKSRKPLLDVLTAVSLGRTVYESAEHLIPHAECALRSLYRLHQIYPKALLRNTVALAARCQFSLDELRYQYPEEVSRASQLSPSQALAEHVWRGAATRYPRGIPVSVQQQIEHELGLIAELRYEMYFLTVFDLVSFAKERHILCQGRGSAANSAVCYCLGITEVDPARSTLLFERFISRARREPPDIDVDFEHERREEVIQYIYQKYGRERAAIAATVISYRPRSAVRDVGKALAIDPVLVEAVAKAHPGVYAREVSEQALDDALKRLGWESVERPSHWTLWLQLARALMRFPRHLGQHVGGFVLTQDKLSRIVPIENARMVDRSLIQWDKDDLDAVGLLKVDVLALGMLTAIRKALALVGQRRGHEVVLQDIPPEDPATYNMLCQADSVGVFQVESRAQMSMLPRLRPQCFYDLVIQVAIVRPGPIQGGMVHPYLRRRRGLEPVVYPSAALQEALGRTLGVPLFQEQVMQVAMLAAGFDAEEADTLRRSMAAWQKKGDVHRFQERIMAGMVSRGYTVAFAQQIIAQIQGFGEYGFPESHAASFALLVYASAWLKCHEPACFLAAMLNSQPLGFYTPSQLVQDAARHGVAVLPVDVMHSDWDTQLAGDAQDQVRLGLRCIAGLQMRVAERLIEARATRPFISVEDLAERAGLGAAQLALLSDADAMASLAGHRRQQVWEAAAWQAGSPLLQDQQVDATDWQWAAPSASEAIVLDHAATGLSLKGHPVGMLRSTLRAERLLSAEELKRLPDGRLARACGLVTVRQQPATAKGVLFITLEDETGCINVVVWRDVKEKFKPEWLHAKLLIVYGVWQRDIETGGQVTHLVAKRMRDGTAWLDGLAHGSRDFH